MKQFPPPHAELSRELDEARQLVGGSRRRSQRRRYLYEIEFFDAAHAASPPARRPAHAELASWAVDDPGDESGLARPVDPRLRELISAAACGWVIGRV